VFTRYCNFIRHHYYFFNWFHVDKSIFTIRFTHRYYQNEFPNYIFIICLLITMQIRIVNENNCHWKLPFDFGAHLFYNLLQKIWVTHHGPSLTTRAQCGLVGANGCNAAGTNGLTCFSKHGGSRDHHHHHHHHQPTSVHCWT
jgi:hypothetical protein